MKIFNNKVQMMDAGMTLFTSEENIGIVIGDVKAKMEEYGKVLKPSDLDEAMLPESTGECDLFMDWSTIWRVRYISCKVESAGEEEDTGLHRYAATFKEGNKSTVFRGLVMSVLILACAYIVIFVPGLLWTLSGLLAAMLISYLWILPSGKSIKVVSDLLTGLKGQCC